MKAKKGLSILTTDTTNDKPEIEQAPYTPPTGDVVIRLRKVNKTYRIFKTPTDLFLNVFLDILKSQTFHERLRELGRPLDAYTWDKAGEIISLD